MLDMGFEPQTEELWNKKICSRLAKADLHVRRPSREMQMMAGDFLNDYVFLTVGRVGAAQGRTQSFQFVDGRINRKL